jgi:hypothetical protein
MQKNPIVFRAWSTSQAIALRSSADPVTKRSNSITGKVEYIRVGFADSNRPARLQSDDLALQEECVVDAGLPSSSLAPVIT